MTPEELKLQMQQLVDGAHPSLEWMPGHWWNGWARDAEVGHIEGDKLLVSTLRSLGYGEAMDIYESQTRWYA